MLRRDWHVDTQTSWNDAFILTFIDVNYWAHLYIITTSFVNWGNYCFHGPLVENSCVNTSVVLKLDPEAGLWHTDDTVKIKIYNRDVKVKVWIANPGQRGLSCAMEGNFYVSSTCTWVKILMEDVYWWSVFTPYFFYLDQYFFHPLTLAKRVITWH